MMPMRLAEKITIKTNVLTLSIIYSMCSRYGYYVSKNTISTAYLPKLYVDAVKIVREVRIGS